MLRLGLGRHFGEGVARTMASQLCNEIRKVSVTVDGLGNGSFVGCCLAKVCLQLFCVGHSCSDRRPHLGAGLDLEPVELSLLLYPLLEFV